jgi:hypothetical protein
MVRVCAHHWLSSRKVHCAARENPNISTCSALLVQKNEAHVVVCSAQKLYTQSEGERKGKRKKRMNQTTLLWLVGVSAGLLIYLGILLGVAQHDVRILQTRRVVMTPDDSGAGCLALLLVVLVAGLALWIYLVS